MMGDDVVLPCQLKLAVDTNAETVNWIKPGLDPDVVHLHKDGRLVFENQNPTYHFRTRVFVDELIKGNVSLKIFNVKLSDEGTYRCSIPWLCEEASIVLTVASASTPVIKVMSNDSSRVVLQCESAGWYPEPELLWLDGEGNLLSAGPTETLRGPDDLYAVSSRVTVEKRHSNNITCRVQQKQISKSRETHIHVPEDFFEIPSSSSAVIIVLAVSLALCIMLLILSAVVLLSRKRKRMMNTNRRTKDQTDSVDAEEARETEQLNTGGGDAEYPLMATQREKQNTSSSSTKTKKQTSYTIKPETDELIQKLMETFLTKLSGSISQHTELQSEKKSEITNQLKEVKVAAEKLKNQLESKNQQTINSETDELIQKLMQTFLTLDSKLSESISQHTELCETIRQAQEEKQKMESEMQRLKNDLDSTKQKLGNKLMDDEKRNEETKEKVKELEKKTETINQLKQEKQAAEILKNQFKSKCHEIIKSEMEMDEIIQKVMETLLTLDSKLQSEKITENIKQQLQELKETTATLKDQMKKNSHETIKSEMELDEFIQKVLQKFPTLDSKCKTNTDISKKLQDVKQAAKHLKAELEFRSREMINSEKEKDEIVTNLMKTFPTLQSKWKKNNETIKQLVQVKQRAEDLKKQLEPQTHEGEEKTETIHQLQQLKQAAETLKIQLESKNQQMIKCELEKDEFIQKLMKIFPALESKWKENTEIINQLQEVKETAEKLEQLEKNNQKNQEGKTDSEIIKQLEQDKETAEKLKKLQLQGMTDSEIIKQLQQDKKTAEKLKQLQLQGETDSKIIDQLQEVKVTAENLKKQLESKNWEMLWAEKMRNDETDRQLKELVKQLEEKKKKTEETLNELVKQLEEEKTESSKPQTGDIILDKVDGYAPYICLRNTSSEDKLMTGWELQLQISNRNPVTYTFERNFTLKAGERLTLHRFGATRKPYPDNACRCWADMSGWYSRDNVKISLISSTGEEQRLM